LETTAQIILKGLIMKLFEIASQFQFDGQAQSIEPFGNGHINDTFLIVCADGDKLNKYILQRLNTHIFPNYAGLMNNVFMVTEFMKKIVLSQGGDVNRETLSLVPTKDNNIFFVDGHDCWRSYLYIDNTIAYQIVDDASIFADSGRAFGKFIARLDDFDATKLCEVIPNFHNTVDRFNNLLNAISANKSGRKDMAKDEIEFALSHQDFCSIIVDSLAKGEIPLRVTHNDTKLNNVIIDATSGKALCVIDLDTIMPGSLLYDFGDSVRFGCSTALEDEQDLSKVDFDINLYDAYCQGFLDGIGDKITAKEVDMLHIGSMMMTLECGMRFLTDFLDGDTYFKTQYPEHNLVRCRTQFKLVSKMEKLSGQMVAIAHKHYNK